MWSIHSKKFKMATGDIVMLVVLNELVASDDEKPRRGKTRNWIKRRKEKGYFNNIVKELKIEDRFGFLSFLLFAFFVCSAFCLTNKSPFLIPTSSLSEKDIFNSFDLYFNDGEKH